MAYSRTIEEAAAVTGRTTQDVLRLCLHPTRRGREPVGRRDDFGTWRVCLVALQAELRTPERTSEPEARGPRARYCFTPHEARNVLRGGQ